MLLQIAKSSGAITEEEVEALQDRVLSGTFGRNLGEVREPLADGRRSRATWRSC